MTAAGLKASSSTLERSADPFRRRMDPGPVVRWTLLFMGAVVMVMPILYMLSTSFKWPHEIYDLRLIPKEPTIENYKYVLEDGRFFTWFTNSTLNVVRPTGRV
jgi:putative chitobiose transport system permease protein